MGPESLNPNPNWIGQSVPRVEDERLMRGRGRFLDDLDPIVGALHAAIVRSPYAHARIRHINTAPALDLPGVVGVVTGADAARELRPFAVGVPLSVPYYPMAVDVARFTGEPVAVVVADSRYTAEDAAALVEVDYEPLPVVMDVEAATRADSPLLHQTAGTNVANHRTFVHGDWDRAFHAGDRVIRARYAYPRNTGMPIETYVVIAEYHAGTDDYTVWANFHGPFTLHAVMSGALKVSPNRLRLMVPPDIGGSFGVKSAVYPYIVLMALASKVLGRPVRWTEDRLEHLRASSSATDRVTYVNGSVTREGKILALEMIQYDDVGAYIRAPEPATLYRTYGNTTGPYDIPALKLDAYAVMTNRVPTGLVRGYGGPQLYFALERFLDEVARQVGQDPAVVRARNLIQPHQMPYRTLTGGQYDSGDYPALLNLALQEAGYEEFQSAQQQRSGTAGGPLLGIGMAVAVEPSGSNMGYLSVAYTPQERAGELPKSGATAAATVAMDPMGGITVRIDSAPEGQGHETVARQIVATVLTVPLDAVRVIAEMDTATSAWSVASGSYSSRFSVAGATAIYRAASKVRDKLIRLGAEKLKVSPDTLTFSHGKLLHNGEDTGLSLRRLAGMTHWNPTDLPPGVEPGVFETCYVTPDNVLPPDAEDRVNSSASYGFLVDLAKVAIDRDTGQVTILDYVTVHDAGHLLNPLLADGQIHGGLAFGIGTALYEEMVYDADGQLLSGTFMDYLMPTVSEVPPIRTVHRNSPSPVTPLGAKGLGEGNVMTAGAAVANAVANALGIDVDRLPLTPEYVWTLVQQAQDRRTSGTVSDTVSDTVKEVTR